MPRCLRYAYVYTHVRIYVDEVPYVREKGCMPGIRVYMYISHPTHIHLDKRSCHPFFSLAYANVLHTHIRTYIHTHTTFAGNRS